MPSIDRFSPALTLPTGKEMIDIIDSRVRQGGGTWRATVVGFDVSNRVRVRRPGQSEPEAKSSPVVGTALPAIGDDVLMLNGQAGDTYCLGTVGALPRPIYGRLASDTPYPYGPFAAEPQWFAGLGPYPIVSLVNSPGYLETGTGVYGGVAGRYAINQRALMCRVTLDSGETVDAINAADVWPSTTDRLVLEDLGGVQMIYDNENYDDTDVLEHFPVTHKIVRVEPDTGDEYGGDATAMGWSGRVQHLVATAQYIGSAQYVSIGLGSFNGADRYATIGIERGWYRVHAHLFLTGTGYENHFKLCVSDSMNNTTPGTAPFGYSPCQLYQAKGSSGAYSIVVIDEIVAITPRGTADNPPNGDPALYWAIWNAVPLSASASREVHIRNFIVERFNPGPVTYAPGTIPT